MTAIDASIDQRDALARELQWLASILPLGTGNERYDDVDDDRVAAIVATALLGLPAQFADDDLSLLALGLGGEALSIDHGYPARVVVPALPGVHNTKWVRSIEFRSA